ncbi:MULTISPECIES: enoyl-CoA hydratase/isomerase family protein [Streptomyces]|uniref:enoyl-CoA hydratase/isomerase family protein n=1 Tax=Streptomyces TaxID=1883 RepID=UPI00081B7697|nr:MULTISPECIES: enoyl-CoA hydratase/isomerase family protein [unclassified Streptomyces]MYQ54107.1 enoyl-CoA hydratase/isomerase family protein [Streptomyces sp. SID4941]SCE18243.1 enoyl-CoA hydratase [Streptomyces sp. PalvLS-984]SDC95789.1 enoyl-CoA hydratase [Streptomyces sp. AmelKG-A3]
MNDDESVLLHTEGHILHITLNRPRALNALTHSMVRIIDEALDQAAGDDAVAAVLISGAGERGLCAGGDIRSIYEDARAGRRASVDFWRDEYRLNARIARFPKPYVALMDGLVMGGGVGVSAHGDIRVVTERSRVAMPETGIGFVPDVGGTRLLATAPGELGTHLALTGRTVDAAGALLCGLADHFVPFHRLPDLVQALSRCAAPAEVTETVRRYAAPAPDAELAAHRAWIDRCYTAGTVEEIIERLADDGAPEAGETVRELLALPPTSLKVTLEAVRRARRLDSLEAALDQEFRVSCRAFDGHDLVEGVRARIIDKDRSPMWDPARLGDVTAGEVARHFQPLGEQELGLAPAP